MKKEAAFSGLEAAIVLIAFVVVAAVFSYVMLGAGFFATQKSQEVTYSGIKQSTSNLVLDGQLYGVMNSQTTPTNMVSTTFYLSIPEGGQPQSLKDVDYVVTVSGTKYTTLKTGSATANNVLVTVLSPDPATTNVLSAGSRAKIQLEFANALPTAGGGPAPGDSFTLEVKPKVGASSLITKTLSTGYNGGVII